MLPRPGAWPLESLRQHCRKRGEEKRIFITVLPHFRCNGQAPAQVTGAFEGHPALGAERLSFGGKLEVYFERDLYNTRVSGHSNRSKTGADCRVHRAR
jgi:hypothetical protein